MMTDKEQYELEKLQSASFPELGKYVDGLLEEEFRRGWSEGNENGYDAGYEAGGEVSLEVA